MRKFTLKEFIEKARLIHGNKYDYSKTIYVTKRDKVTITCPIHGDFVQCAGHHVRGQGCPECGKIKAKLRNGEYKNSRKNILTFKDDIKNIFGDKYEVIGEYINNKTKIELYCKEKNKDGIEHGSFFARPDSLMQGHGCKHFKNGKIYKEKFIKKYGDKYDYSYIVDDMYYDAKDVIKIICKEHGPYEQKIKNHLTKCGCPECGKEKISRSKKLSFNIVKERLTTICEGKFTYNINDYINTNTPFPLTCIKCGNTFKRDLNALQTNDSCPFCNGKPRNRRYTTEEFIQLASTIHEYKYDYSKSVYKQHNEKLCVICHEKDRFGNEHGEFYVTPHSHISITKTGCPKCSGKYQKTTNDFINEANEMHDFYYDYSKTSYKNAKTKVCIICPEHGEFWQTPNGHLTGNGCPVCKQSKCERQIKKILKDNAINFIPQYKPTWLCNMSLDFFLPDKNIAIEVQGLQHYKPVKYWGGEITFQKVVERDKKKKTLCEENNVKLIYYSELKTDLPEDVIKNITDLLDILK